MVMMFVMKMVMVMTADDGDDVGDGYGPTVMVGNGT